MAAKRRVALYARVSTEDQDAELQLTRLRDWSSRMDYDTVGEFKEVASGRLVRRPEQDKVMSLVRGHHVHIVAAVKLDRWGRSLIDLRNSIDAMTESGVSFHAIEQGFVFEKKTAQGHLLLNLLGAFAEFEAEMISDRTKDALKSKKASGKPWVSKSGRTVSKLGPDFHPCFQCGGPRFERLRGKRGGKVVMLCRACKGLPARAKPKEEKEEVMVYDKTLGDETGERHPTPRHGSESTTDSPASSKIA